LNNNDFTCVAVSQVSGVLACQLVAWLGPYLSIFGVLKELVEASAITSVILVYHCCFQPLLVRVSDRQMFLCHRAQDDWFIHYQSVNVSNN
jgi:hypothetical protein